MGHRVRLACTLLIILFLLPTARAAQENGFRFRSIGAGAEILGYTGPGGAVTIPVTLGGTPVLSIGTYAFFERPDLTSVVLPTQVKAIKGSAFEACTGLTSIRIPDGVEDIQDAAFSNCSSLRTISLPKGLTNLGSYAFFRCTRLETLTIPGDLATIGSFAFSFCSSLKSIHVHEQSPKYSSVEGVLFDKTRHVLITYPAAKAGDYAVPNGTTTIQYSAFDSCDLLTGVAIPPSVTTLDVSAFENCPKLRAINVAPLNSNYSSLEGVLLDKAQAKILRYPPSKLGAYTPPITVTTIGGRAFVGCTGLDSISIGRGLTVIPDSAFLACGGLTHVEVGREVIYFGYKPFDGCSNLVEINVSPLNAGYSSVRGALLNKPQTALIICPQGKSDYTIPGSVVEILEYAFFGCGRLKNLVFPTSLTTIGYRAFEGCVGLVTITIPKTVKFIDALAFAYCYNLAGAYFEGSPPGNELIFFNLGSLPSVIVFHTPEAPGWGSTYSGRRTALWPTRPGYAEWASSTGLTAQYPSASGETSDPDGDGSKNRDEWLGGTDPIRRLSVLQMELTPRQADLADSDKTPVPADKRPIYFRSVPGRGYALQSSIGVNNDLWSFAGSSVASSNTSQTRLLVPKEDSNTFYRVYVLP